MTDPFLNRSEHAPNAAPLEQEASTDFAPIFIVGPGRSGTTLMAVLLDRHSRLAVTPETHFFPVFVPKHRELLRSAGREEMVSTALSARRIEDLKLEPEAVLERFTRYHKTFGNLFRAILETYAAAHNAARPAEKTPLHIEHVHTIFKLYPHAKVIGMMRDGRDVVRSTEKLQWRGDNPRGFGIYCQRWSDLAKLTLKLEKRFGPERFMLVKYEDLILKGREEIERVCRFIGECFEPSQLDPSVGTGVVPGWERNWKDKAKGALDPSRVEAWRRCEDPDRIWVMNCMMGRMLRRFGYADANLVGCPWAKKLRFLLMKIPYCRPFRVLAVPGLKILRKFGIDPGGGMPR